MNTLSKDTASDLAFKFGFLAVRENQTPRPNYISGWDKESFEGIDFYLHPTTGRTIIHTPENKCLGMIIGEAFCCSGKNLDSVLTDFLKYRDWDLLDEISGRFVLIFKDLGEICAVQDPFGSRTVYYYKGEETCFSSHASLVGEQLDLNLDPEAKKFIKLPEYKQRGTGYLPGKRTMYSKVKCLLPNSYLRINSNDTIRFWPRRDLKKGTLEAYLQEVDTYFECYARHLTNMGLVPLLGLTGGVDTRGVIAGLAAKGLPIELVTWTGSRLPDSEVDIVKEMVNHLKKPHKYIEPGVHPKTDEDKILLEASNIATGYCRGRSRLSLSMAHVTGPEYIFVRGYGGEILRGFYNRHLKGRKIQPDRSNLEDLFYSLYKTARVKEPSEDFNNFVRSAFRELIDGSYIGNNFFGYDILDIFYWEQRMGVWGANMHNEMDPAVYSNTGLNSRRLFEAAFSLEEEYRLGEQLMIDTTAIFDKKFSNIGIFS